MALRDPFCCLGNCRSGDRIDRRQELRRPETPVPVRPRDDRRRNPDAPAPRHGGGCRGDARPRKCSQARRLRLRCRPLFRLLRHWGWIPDRPGAHRRNRHADDFRGGLLACRRHCIRAHDGRQLCAFRARRLDLGGGVRGGRAAGERSRRQGRQEACGRRPPQQGVRRADLRCGSLHALEKR